MIHVNRKSYPYMEEVNEGILKQFERMLPVTGRVLDVGCGRAALGGAIRALGWEVWGVEQSEEACATAEKRIHTLVRADLHDYETVRARLGDTRFDALGFSDVLEHVYDPRTVLEKYLGFVKPGGKVLLSLPNAVVWTNRLSLLLGRVEYADTGVMDRTHIRFFTFRTAKRLVRAAGLSLDRVSSTPYLARALLPVIKTWLPGKKGNGAVHDPRALIDSRGYKAYMKWAYPVEHAVTSVWRGMFAFRIILVATKPAEPEA
jgi:2-polyprenyl-3-methyl-5-hydroxy-6-metoxy-1,4-benzoquinol methylase